MAEPLQQTVGAAVLLVLPGVLLVDAVLFALLASVHPRADDARRLLVTGAMLAVGAAALGLPVALLSVPRSYSLAYAPLAFFAFGGTQLLFALVAFRILSGRRFRHVAAFAVPALLGLPAFALAPGLLPRTFGASYDNFLLYGGYVGLLSPGWFAVLLLEAVVRRLLANRRRRALTPSS